MGQAGGSGRIMTSVIEPIGRGKKGGGGTEDASQCAKQIHHNTHNRYYLESFKVISLHVFSETRCFQQSLSTF